MTAPALPGARPPRRRTVRRWLIATAAVVGALSLGIVLAAPAQVGPGTTEQGQGADVGEAGPAYWVWVAAQVETIPTPVPGALSATVTLPTVLSTAATSYRIDAATAGNTSVRWEFAEQTTAPVSTEVELRFTVGLSRAAAHLTVYVETQTAAPGAALDFYVYWDAGSFAPTGLAIETMQIDALPCTSVGHCP